MATPSALDKVKVKVIHPTGDKQTPATLPVKVKVNKLVRALVVKLGLPLEDTRGTYIQYTLSHLNGTERELHPDETLTTAGIQDDDKLKLRNQMMAG